MTCGVQVNDNQIKLRGLTRRLMATVSELSMLQAHSMKYKADKEGLEQVVQTASDRLQVIIIWSSAHSLTIHVSSLFKPAETRAGQS